MRPLIIRLPYRTERYEAVRSFSILQNEDDPTKPPFQFMLRPDHGLGIQSVAVGAVVPAMQIGTAADIQICPMYDWEMAVKALESATVVLGKLQLPDSRFSAGDYPILDLVHYTSNGQDDWLEERENAKHAAESSARERVIDLTEGAQRPTLTDVAQASQPQPMMPNSPTGWTAGVNQVQPSASADFGLVMRQILGCAPDATEAELTRRMQEPGADLAGAVRVALTQIRSEQDIHFNQVMQAQQRRLQEQAAVAGAAIRGVDGLVLSTEEAMRVAGIEPPQMPDALPEGWSLPARGVPDSR